MADNVVGVKWASTLGPPSRGNYASYHEFKEAADAVFQEELKLGRLEWAPMIGELAMNDGPIARSRIAGVAK